MRADGVHNAHSDYFVNLCIFLLLCLCVLILLYVCLMLCA